MVKPEQCSVAEEKQLALIKPAFLMQNRMDPSIINFFLNVIK